MVSKLELLEAKIRILNIMIAIQLQDFNSYKQVKPFFESELAKIEQELKEVQ